jgi:hypothetical protein
MMIPFHYRPIAHFVQSHVCYVINRLDDRAPFVLRDSANSAHLGGFTRSQPTNRALQLKEAWGQANDCLLIGNNLLR